MFWCFEKGEFTMKIRELNRGQLIELKQSYLSDKMLREEDRTPSYGELADADELVSDEEIFAQHDDTSFSPDDFFSQLVHAA